MPMKPCLPDNNQIPNQPNEPNSKRYLKLVIRQVKLIENVEISTRLIVLLEMGKGIRYTTAFVNLIRDFNGKSKQSLSCY
ncbi:hypothetical protein SVI_3367 [Shewanella violacea DSS12]|uniref:Uncharacterized protein n=1 Tax=Shewanella violacea (strain JCM 10179 / CIP 106290 / LMG 19151 / DSS12) TaxID=637905 RepID=D4ZBE3_SHEVD|nr:hypothetical protein SVI_3367 [Shewanella violacea DSS12]